MLTEPFSSRMHVKRELSFRQLKSREKVVICMDGKVTCFASDILGKIYPITLVRVDMSLDVSLHIDMSNFLEQSDWQSKCGSSCFGSKWNDTRKSRILPSFAQNPTDHKVLCQIEQLKRCNSCTDYRRRFFSVRRYGNRNDARSRRFRCPFSSGIGLQARALPWIVAIHVICLLFHWRQCSSIDFNRIHLLVEHWWI